MDICTGGNHNHSHIANNTDTQQIELVLALVSSLQLPKWATEMSLWVPPNYTIECLLFEVFWLYTVWSFLSQIVNTCILSQNHAFRSQCTSFDNFLVSPISETFHFSTYNCLQVNYKSGARILWPAVVFMYRSARNDFHHFILFSSSWILARPTSVYTWPRSSWTVE